VIRKLIDKRNQLRIVGEYQKSDEIRKRLLKEGYQVIDADKGNQIFRFEGTNLAQPKNSFIVLFGSGEISPFGRKVHQEVFEKIGKDKINLAIITTPAGFQPNVKIVYEEIAQFFQDRLQNFHPKIKIIYANNLNQANDPFLVDQINQSDYIFTGPGSPTYASRHLAGSLLLKRIKEKVSSGSSLSLASAATIAFSGFTLPVYEIYKVGVDKLFWEKGLDFFKDFLGSITVIPHFNNTEGGEKTDTSRCFVGRQRFEKLLKLLPQGEGLWGIDEQTGIIIDLKTKTKKVIGQGKFYPFQAS